MVTLMSRWQALSGAMRAGFAEEVLRTIPDVDKLLASAESDSENALSVLKNACRRVERVLKAVAVDHAMCPVPLVRAIPCARADGSMVGRRPIAEQCRVVKGCGGLSRVDQDGGRA